MKIFRAYLRDSCPSKLREWGRPRWDDSYLRAPGEEEEEALAGERRGGVALLHGPSTGDDEQRPRPHVSHVSVVKEENA